MDQNTLKKLYTSMLELFESGVCQAAVIDSLNIFRDLPLDEQRRAFVVDREINRVPHQESNEEMVDLATFAALHNARWICAAGTSKYGAKEGSIKLRLSAATCLLEAEQHLRTLSGQNLTFLITDAYRPLALQRQYFEDIQQEIREKEGLTGEALYEKAHMLIADPDLFPPHTTGGAIDLTVTDLDTGEELDMGTKVDEVESVAVFTFYPDLITSQKEHRALLLTSMISAGFVNYPPEWWHYSYGDKEWALRSNQPFALYLPC